MKLFTVATDALVSEQEFKDYWMSKTGTDETRTVMLFGYLDADDDGYFGNDFEQKGLFLGTDYNRKYTVERGQDHTLRYLRGNLNRSLF